MAKEKDKRTDTLIQIRLETPGDRPRTAALDFRNVHGGEEILAMQELFEVVLSEVFNSKFNVSIIEKPSESDIILYADPANILGGRKLRRRMRRE